VVETHDDFPGVEISIIGGVGEMVREEMGGSEASLYRAPRGIVETIGCPPGHPVPERVEFLKCACVRDKEVAAIGEDRKYGAKN